IERNSQIQEKKIPHNDSSIHLYADRSLKQAPNFSELQKRFTTHFTGGAVMNSINVLTHQNSFYFKYPKEEIGGCAIWDLAAASLILKEAGCIVTGFHGEDLNFNQVNTIYFNQQGLIICSNLEVYKKVKLLIESI
ncbi:hypothetical protein N9B72_01495, partial [Bacteriovoracaceae bacterium]|nr:hypothetical protein [Bacteriovoracaceae bacterium]